MAIVTMGAEAASAGGDGAAATLALFLLVVAIAGWLGLRSAIRRMRARKTAQVVGGEFADYALQALVNAAKIDGRVNDAERHSILLAMRQIAGETFEAASVESAFDRAKLSKNELLAFLMQHSRAFSRDQKTALLQALLAVFVADGRFDQVEHAALIDYTEAVGFDRQAAPEMLRGLAGEIRKGNIV